MKFDFKKIHIGSFIEKKVLEIGMDKERICNFLKCNEEKLNEMYISENLTSDILLNWCKLLEYDFFRIYSHHLILYAPVSSNNYITHQNKSELPKFRKNVYTKEIIDFLLSLVANNEKTITQVINEYRIPKTTFYKWIQKDQKYNLSSENKKKIDINNESKTNDS